jgi:hypothetical protein
MKIYQAVQKLLVEDTQTDMQTGDLIHLLSVLESGLKMAEILYYKYEQKLKGFPPQT